MSAAPRKNRCIRFEISTAVPLPAGEQVFITGNTNQFECWNPAAIPLTREKDNVWTGSCIIPADLPLEYKITRGSWASEEVTPDHNIPGNKRLEAGVSGNTLQHWIHHWKDLRMGPPPEITGNYDILENVPSKVLSTARNVLVWLPTDYYKDSSKKYPVLYMQDGQQVFDPNTSTWNQAWNIDNWCTELIASGKIRETIVVAPYCTTHRETEYNPDEQGENYIRFLLLELMPIIQRDFRILTGPENTSIAGASLGATIAFYAAWKHPNVFSKAACLSPSFRFNESKTCFDLVNATQKKPDLRLFFYVGQGDELEQELTHSTREMVELLQRKKFKPGRELLFTEDPEGKHDEATWAKHSGEWLEFLLGR